MLTPAWTETMGTSARSGQRYEGRHLDSSTPAGRPPVVNRKPPRESAVALPPSARRCRLATCRSPVMLDTGFRGLAGGHRRGRAPDRSEGAPRTESRWRLI
jgi:hypothetical protein